MATVDSSQIIRITNSDGGTWINVPSGGGAPGANTEVFLQGVASVGKRLSNVTDTGFAFDGGSGVNFTGRHVGVWVFFLHYAAMTALKGILVTDASNYGRFNVFDTTTNKYPALGGWVRLWINADLAPSSQVGTFNKESVRYFGIQLSVPAVGSGNAANVFIDAIDYTTGGLILTGTSGVFQDFVTADENTSNKYGIIISNAGVIYCFGRLILGTATSLVFNDSNFVVVFPNQPTVASNFMGISVDLSHTNTDIVWEKGVIRSAGAVKGDLIVTGTSGSFSITNSSLSGLRLITLTSKPVLTGCLISSSGLINASGASLLGCTIIESTSSPALLWDVNVNTNSKLDGTQFISAGSGHAIELGTNCPSEITLTDVTFSNYGANATADAAIFNNSGKAITINISGGTSPTVLNGSGASTVVNDAVTLTIAANISLSGAEVRIYDLNASGNNLGTELDGVESNSGTTFPFSGSAGNEIWIQIMKDGYEEFGQSVTMPSINSTLTVILKSDINI